MLLPLVIAVGAATMAQAGPDQFEQLKAKAARLEAVIAAENEPRPEALPGRKFGSWTVSAQIDPFTDKRIIQVSTTNATGAKLSVRCGDENKAEISYRQSAVVVGRVFGIVRVDGEEAMDIAGDISADRKEMTIPSVMANELGERNLMGDMRMGLKLIIQLQATRGTSPLNTFSLTGFNAAYRSLNCAE